MNNFEVFEYDVGERHFRYYISRNEEDKWYSYANLGQDKCAAMFLLNKHEAEL